MVKTYNKPLQTVYVCEDCNQYHLTYKTYSVAQNHYANVVVLRPGGKRTKEETNELMEKIAAMGDTPAKEIADKLQISVQTVYYLRRRAAGQGEDTDEEDTVYVKDSLEAAEDHKKNAEQSLAKKLLEIEALHKQIKDYNDRIAYIQEYRRLKISETMTDKGKVLVITKESSRIALTLEEAISLSDQITKLVVQQEASESAA
jgi:hypothetical protein